MADETKIYAIPVANGNLCQHFGHCEQFALVTVNDGKVVSVDFDTPPPHEPGVLPKWLAEKNVNIVIAGGMGSRAQGLFEQNGIHVVVGAPVGDPKEIVSNYLNGTLVTSGNVCDH